MKLTTEQEQWLAGERGIAPLAILFREVSPIFAQGSIFAGLPTMHGLSPDLRTTIDTGDTCKLFPGAGRIVVRRCGGG